MTMIAPREYQLRAQQQGLGAMTRWGIDLDNPEAGTDPVKIAAVDALFRAESSPSYQTWSSDNKFYGNFINLSNLVGSWNLAGSLSASAREELVNRTAILNQYLSANHLTPIDQWTPYEGNPAATQSANGTTTTTNPTPTPNNTTTSAPSGTSGLVDSVTSALANLSTPVKIGGAALVAFMVFGGRKRGR